MTKSNPGNFLEDFVPGQTIAHATPRTITEGDVALNIALTGSRYALFSADSFAQDCGLPAAPIDPLLVFHVVFGKSVPDISLNAVANLGYADCRFLKAVYPGDTLTSTWVAGDPAASGSGSRSVLKLEGECRNQSGALVAEGHVLILAELARPD